MLFENSKQVKLSEVELNPVSTNELKVIFVPQSDYEEERRIFNENYPDGDSEFNMFYEILFTVYVTYEGQPGVLVFTYNADTAPVEEEERKELNPTAVLRCTIPTGARYFEGDDDYCSDTLVVEEVLTEYVSPDI